MAHLALAKRRVAKRIDSEALKGDAANSMTRGVLATTVLIGLVLMPATGGRGLNTWRRSFSRLAHR